MNKYNPMPRSLYDEAMIELAKRQGWCLDLYTTPVSNSGVVKIRSYLASLPRTGTGNVYDICDFLTQENLPYTEYGLLVYEMEGNIIEQDIKDELLNIIERLEHAESIATPEELHNANQWTTHFVGSWDDLLIIK